jgi:hypothetical protein
MGMSEWLGGGMVLGTILLGVVLFILAILFIRWVFGIGKIIDLLTRIEQNTNPDMAPRRIPEREPASRVIG